MDCGGKRSATPLSHARDGLIVQLSSPARKRRRRFRFAGALHDALVPSANPNGIQIHQPRVGGPRRTGEERLPWETVPQIHQL